MDEVEILVDDGSTDRTIEVARFTVSSILSVIVAIRGWHAHSATVFTTRSGHGADIVVNTDGDNQYPQAEIARLVRRHRGPGGYRHR